MSTVIGIDLGGTKIRATLYDKKTFEVLATKKVQTNVHEAFTAVYAQLLEIIAELRRPDTIGIGIGVPGLIKQPSGVIHTVPNIPGAEGFALKQHLAEATGLTVEADNDANCFALGEALQGSGKGHSVVIGITLGTGVGGGIIINGTIFHGADGFSAEVGHMLLLPGQPPFETKDKRGEVEQFFSGTAMGKRCAQATEPSQYLEGAVCSFMHKDIYKEVSWFLVNIIHLLNPSIIIFGGSAGHAISKHFPALKTELQNWLLPGTPLPEITLESLDDSATLGAALLV
jgi:glucokinase